MRQRARGSIPQIAAFLTLSFLMARAPGASAQSAPASGISSFTTISRQTINPVSYTGPPILPEMPEFFTGQPPLPILTPGTRVTVEKSRFRNGHWLLREPSGFHKLSCGPEQPNALPTIAFDPGVAQMIAAIGQTFTKQGLPGPAITTIVDNQEIPQVTYEGWAADAFSTEVITRFDQQGKTSQISLITSYFVPVLQDPLFSCLFKRGNSPVAHFLPKDEAFNAVVGEMTHLRSVTLLQSPGNVVLFGPPFPSNRFLLYAQIQLFPIGMLPKPGSIPYIVYTIKNTDITH